MNQSVRTRFAPSPTGLLHVGNLRAGLFSYLFAKHHNGTFILRLEDTDRERYVVEAIKHLEESMRWLGIEPDEGYWLGDHVGSVGPYVQSERLPNYKKYAQKLIESGNAYYSRIAPEVFSKLKQDAISQKRAFVYKQEFEPADDGKKEGYPIRLKVKPGQTTWHDEIRGDFTSNNDNIDDFVIIKADGYPTYNFANVIDDHLMNISHVIRGDEYIPSVDKYAYLYDILDWQRPKFIHLPLILGPDGKKKLSKRDGDVDVLSYRAEGYLSDALVNFLALLGWNDGTEQEIFHHDELISKFDVNRVQTSPAVFDRARLDWMNGEYIRALSIDEFMTAAKPWLPEDWQKDQNYLKSVAGLEQERVKRLSQLPELLDFFFEEPKIKPELLFKKNTANEVKQWLQQAAQALANIEFTQENIEDALRKLTQTLKVSPGNLFYTIRVAITGRTEAPGLFETIHALGKEKTIARLRAQS